MFKSEVDETRMPKWLAAQDAQERSRKFAQRFTQAQHAHAQEFYDCVRSAYIRSRVFLNCREETITVKVERPQLSDKISPAAHNVISRARQLNMKIVETRTGLIFHTV